MKRTNIFLPVPLREQLRALADQKDTSVAELVRRAIEEFLAKHREQK